ncbi:MAG: hypothetical protein IKH77_07385 [Clostridia bacterium]|nr:hypothetical protein [Clostridia bacterium]
MLDRDKRHGNAYEAREPMSRGKRILSWIAVVVAVAAIALVLVTLVRLIFFRDRTTRISANLLPCAASQDVTIMGDRVLYYDGSSIHCMGAAGGIQWSVPVGAGAQFSASDNGLVIWLGTDVYVVDGNGHTTYNASQDGAVQFARLSGNYCAIVYGEDTKPVLSVRNLDGGAVDSEREAYEGMLLLDVGFYGEADQYMWTLAMDVYGVTINTVLNTFQVGKMNTGLVNLGEYLAYRVIYDNGTLRVYTTQQMFSFNYKAVQDMSGNQLVHGWQVIGVDYPQRGNANILLAKSDQLNAAAGLSELRVMTGQTDRRFDIPSLSVGAVVYNGSIYAVSGSQIYHTGINRQQFYSHQIPLPEGMTVTGLIGVTSGGRIIVACGDSVYSVTLPR